MFGFSTTSKTRPLIISKLDDYFRDKSVTIRSHRLIEEMFTFIWNGNRAEGMKGYNDDLTMSLVIGLWVRDTHVRLRQEGIDLTKNIRRYWNTNTWSPWWKLTTESFRIKPTQQQVGDTNEDLTWLIK